MIKEYINKEVKLNKEQKIGILASVFVIAGLIGWLYEFFFYWFNSGFKQFYMRGGNFLPWINVYAYGAFLIIFLTYKRRKHPFQVFLISMISTGLLEYLSGYILYEKLGFIRCWSYNEEAFTIINIGGYTCLRSIIAFGLSGLLLIYGLLPLLIKISQKVNSKTFMIISLMLCSVIIIDEVYNLIFYRLLSLPKASRIYKNLGLKYIYFKK